MKRPIQELLADFEAIRDEVEILSQGEMHPFQLGFELGTVYSRLDSLYAELQGYAIEYMDFKVNQLLEEIDDEEYLGYLKKDTEKKINKTKNKKKWSISKC